ncbi:MAG: carboxypeptidase-like regulatory domain-containing protein, partial [Pyrinomonadaceae bacterium]
MNKLFSSVKVHVSSQTISGLRSSRQLKLLRGRRLLMLVLIGLLVVPALDLSGLWTNGLSPVPTAQANSTYFNFSGGSLSLSIAPSNFALITSNDDWSVVNSVEGYFGQNLTATHGIDPQTVLTSEFATLPSPGNTQVSANKGNPSAFNAGGVAEFDTGTYLSLGLQGNVQANPYLVFYLNTTGRVNVTIDYTVQDIDGGSNSSVSPLALQYRVGETGNFTNVPAGYIADATDGGVAGRITTRHVVLPVAVNNKPKVQLRLITTNAADSGGSSTPDEWIGINSVSISAFVPTAANSSVSGRVTNANGRPIFGAALELLDQMGTTRTVITNPFGYFT